VLKYPLELGMAGMPFVIFKAYEWSLPEATGADGAKPRKPSTIEEVGLYFPNGFQESVGATWGPEELFNAENGIAQELAKGIGDMANKTIGGKVVNSAKAYYGKTVGPTDLLLFSRPNPYSFTLTFDFIPRSAPEGDAVVKIIKNFKLATLPSAESKGIIALLKFPPVFDIKFGNINGIGSPSTPDGLYKNMALQSCSVSYSGGANSALVFHDKNPVRTSINLSFQSVEYAIRPA